MLKHLRNHSWRTSGFQFEYPDFFNLLRTECCCRLQHFKVISSLSLTLGLRPSYTSVMRFSIGLLSCLRSCSSRYRVCARCPLAWPRVHVNHMYLVTVIMLMKTLVFKCKRHSVGDWFRHWSCTILHSVVEKDSIIYISLSSEWVIEMT